MKKKVVLLLLAVLAGSFAWGFFAHRDRMFPYSLLTALKRSVEPPEIVQVSSRAARDGLVGLAYLDGTLDPDRKARGVLIHDRTRAYAGLGFYNSRIRHTAHLIDMDGIVVHEWTYPSDSWQHSQLLPDGDVLAVVKDHALLRIDRDSNLRWKDEDRYNHGTWVDGEGRIYAMARRAEVVPAIHESLETVVDRIVVLSPDGVKLEDISVLDIILGSPYAFLLPVVREDGLPPPGENGISLDLLHLNHVAVLDGSLAHRSPLFAKDNLLISMRNINAIAILAAGTREILWLWGPSNLAYQHHPTLLGNGRVLIFDNGIERSEVLEVDPLTGKIPWRYTAPGFFSATREARNGCPTATRS